MSKKPLPQPPPMDAVPAGQMLRLDLLLTPECLEAIDAARQTAGDDCTPEDRNPFVENLLWGSPAIQKIATEKHIVRRTRPKRGKPLGHVAHA